MRNPEERELALECLRLALGGYQYDDPKNVLANAERFYGFVSGTSEASAGEKLAAVREAVS